MTAGLGGKRGVMWAGVMDDHIATARDESKDPYTPITIALFSTEREARRHYEHVVRVDVDALLHVAETARK